MVSWYHGLNPGGKLPEDFRFRMADALIPTLLNANCALTDCFEIVRVLSLAGMAMFRV